MASLMLCRIAEGQFFLDGNKRTALMSCFFFLRNNGYNLHCCKDELNKIIWGLAADPNDPSAPRKYKEEDVVQYITDNTTPLPAN